MLKKCYTLWALAAFLLASGCRKETGSSDFPIPPAQRQAACASVPVQILGDTKSVVSATVEDFVDAYLFAYWADTKELCTAGIYTRERSFEWTLPVGLDASGAEQHIDVWALVNPSSDIRETLDDYLESNSNGPSQAQLLALNYTCEDAQGLIRMEKEGTHMPMSGILEDLYLEKASDPLSLTLRRLFARYDIRLNTSRFQQAGWTVSASKIVGARSNTQAPYFYTGSGNGFGQQDVSRMASVDFATDADLEAANGQQYVTLYFLENCQGEIRKDDSSPASAWYSVGKDLEGKLDLCTCLDIHVLARKEGYGQRKFSYRLYLGQSDMTTSFDVVRNRQKKLHLTLDSPTDGFQWDSSFQLKLAPGESILLPFETSLLYRPAEGNELWFSVEQDGVEVPDVVVDAEPQFQENGNLSRQEGSGPGQRRTDYAHCGTVQFRALPTAREGNYILVGHDSAGDIRGEIPLSVKIPYYAGFRLGRLPLNGALGYPVTEEQAAQLMGDYYKCVPLPAMTENPYLWSHTAEYGGSCADIEEAFRSCYELRLNFSDAAGDAVEPNVRLWWFAQGDRPLFFYGASDKGSPSALLPALCQVEIHAKEDPDPERWVEWFQFGNLIQYEYGYELQAESDGVDCWTGRVRFGKYARVPCFREHEPSQLNMQPVQSLFDLPASAHMLITVPADIPVSPGTGLSKQIIHGTGGADTPIEVLHGNDGLDPLYTLILRGLSSPDTYTETFTAYNVGAAQVLEAALAPYRRSGDYLLLPSEYLSARFGAADASCPYYPGILLRPSAKKWIRIDDNITKTEASPTETAPWSASYYQVDLYPDASYDNSSLNVILNGYKYKRTDLLHMGLRVSTHADAASPYPITPISFAGNSDQVQVNGQGKPIESVISRITFRYESYDWGVPRYFGSTPNIVRSTREYSFSPTRTEQKIAFTWNNWAASGAAGGYLDLNWLGFVSQEDTREPLPMLGWDLSDFPVTDFTRVPWQNLLEVSAEIRPPYDSYGRETLPTRFIVKTQLIRPAEGAYD